MKTAILFSTTVLSALSAGFFFAWSVSVILGTKKVPDMTYLETMQSINREILNPVFFTVFFGSLFALILNAYFQFQTKPVFWFALAAALVYAIGTFGITAFGNVPLNNALDQLDLTQLASEEAHRFRTYYEESWNRLHNLRTTFGIVSFILLLISIFKQQTP